MNIASIAFFLCCGVGLVCGARLFIRAYTQMHWLGYGQPGDPILQLIGDIKLRNTAELELVGFVGSFLLSQIVIRYM
jgi:hypothetical protein